MDTVLLSRQLIGWCLDVDASLGFQQLQPSVCTAEPPGSMGRAETDAWADTFAQLMAEKKPQDVWVLQYQENLVDGHVDNGGLQYQLKGLSRLECVCCPWTWGSAHVHILFHLWWDGDCGQGLVRMRVRGQQCQLCPQGTAGDCQVSPRDVPTFLGHLVLYILQKCYGDGHTPQHCSEILSGDCCEACDLGVCFLLKLLNSAGEPAVQSICALKSRETTKSSSTPSSGGNFDDANSQHLLAHSCRPDARGTRAHVPKPITISLLVIDFTEDTSDSNFLSQDDSTVIVPFSLMDTADGHDPMTLGEGSLTAPGSSQPPVIGQGSIHLSGGAMPIPKGKDIPVNLRAPSFHGPGLPGSLMKPFELRGFLFRGQGSTVNSTGVTRGQGPISFSNVPIIPGNDLLPVPYSIGLLPNGEGAITFPFTVTNIIRGKDTFPDMSEDTARKDGGQNATTDGPNPPLESPTHGPIAREEGSLTFPFIFTGGVKDKASFTDISKNKEKEAGSIPSDLLTAGHDAPPGTNADCPNISEGALTIPFSVFSIIKHTGPSYMAKSPQHNGFVTYGYYAKKRLRSRFGTSNCRSYWKKDFHARKASHRLHTETYEDLWVCISMAICIFWLMCMYRLNLGTSQQQA